MGPILIIVSLSLGCSLSLDGNTLDWVYWPVYSVQFNLYSEV